jgi:hypothetical protein
MSDEHLPVDETLIEGWASQESYRRKDGKRKPPGPGGEVDFTGRRGRTRHTNRRRMLRRDCSRGPKGAKLGYLGHVLMEKRNGLLVPTFLTEANRRAERDAAMLMAKAIPSGKRVTLGGDKNYETQEFVGDSVG